MTGRDDPTISGRDFPFLPTTSRDLEVGDFWAVELPDGHFGCLQVTELARQGPGSRSTFVAGVVDWWGNASPSSEGITGRRILTQGLTRIEAFTEMRARVLGRAVVTHDRVLPSHYRDHFAVGAVHHVWGWKTLASVVADTLKNRS